jgi:hypothetical protein
VTWRVAGGPTELPDNRVRPRRRWVLAVAGLGLAGAALRLPFLDAPLTADEGGYGEVARLWSQGHALYHGAWVDRPQGLILVFRGALSVDLTSTVDLRMVAAGFAVLLILLAALLAEQVGGWRRGLVVAGLVATAGASPFIEAFTLSGELIANVFAVTAILAFTRYLSTGQRTWLLFSGLSAGSGWMVKQSAIDAAITVAVCLALQRRRTRAHIPLFAVAVAAPIAAGILLSGNPEAWFKAVIVYGLHASGSAMTFHERWTLFRRSLGPAAKALSPVVLLAVLGWRRAPALARIWLSLSVAGVLLGGNFHPHYYLQLVVPLSLIAAFVPLPSRWMTASVAVAAGVTVLFALPIWRATDVAQARTIWPRDTHLQSDSVVAAFIRNNSRPSQQVYVLWAAADLYYLADRRPTLPYLWLRNVQTIDGAIESVRQSLDRRDAALVVVEQTPASVDPSGSIATALLTSYRLKARVHGIAIYEPKS